MIKAIILYTTLVLYGYGTISTIEVYKLNDEPKTGLEITDTIKDIEEKKELTKEYDLDKIAYAVAVAETGDCTKGSGASKNNCFGIMAWDKQGNRYLREYQTTKESYEHFKAIWDKSYGVVPNYTTAWKWVCGSRAKTCPEASVWLKNVNANL